ncbi:MAG: histidine phosphatase family protein [Pseudomonadota bacterium]|nr:histidine phosphatase family protein [Pseudomonadota bacterium]
MKHQLIIVRHAKSAWDDASLEDYERPLSPRGRNDIPPMARWLATHQSDIDLILSSSAKRTRQTAQLLCEHAGLDPKKIKWQDALYLADTTTLLDAIGQTPAKIKQLMLIGHNPGLEELLTYLGGDELPLTRSGKLLTTATIAIVAIPDGWQTIKPHSCHLVELMRPKELPQQ